MINEAATVDDATLQVIAGVELHGRVNVEDQVLLDNIRSAIRRGHPQVRPQGANYDRVALVGSGPSLKDTLPELRQLVQDGAKLVTLNGAYHYCLEHHLQPRTQIVMDARASNARFVEPALPDCRYVLASQCHPDVWDAVAGRPHVWIFHAATGADDATKHLLDAYYAGQWFGVGGGVTVLTRAINVLRTLGYLRFDLFGADSCWMGGDHHAFAQPENETDRCVRMKVWPEGEPEKVRKFICSPWHIKQFEDFLQMIRVNGDHFLLNVHGSGLLAYALEASADVEWSKETD